jgi:hypothetical protein
MSEYVFDLFCDGDRRIVSVEADSYEDASAAIAEIRDRDFPGLEIEDHS